MKNQMKPSRVISCNFFAEVLERRMLLAAVDWIGGAAGNWNDPGNWSGGAVPTLNDDVRIFGIASEQPVVTHDSGDHAVNSISLANATLTMDGGALSIISDGAFNNPSTLNFNSGTLLLGALVHLYSGAMMDWSGGLLDGAGALVAGTGSVLNLHDLLESELTISTTIQNDGTTNWDGRPITLDGATFINNGRFNASPGRISTTGGDDVFENAGTFMQSGPGAVEFWGYMRFINTGTVHSSATISMLGIAWFEMFDGTLQGNLHLAPYGELDWYGGTMDAGGITTVENSAWLRISGPDSKVLRRVLRSTGRTAYLSSDLVLENGTLDIDNESVYGLSVSGASLLNGGGTNLVNASTLYVDGDASFFVPLTVGGIWNFGGVVHALAGGSSSGSSNIGEMHVGGGGFTFTGGFGPGPGSGNLYFDGGTSTVSGDPLSMNLNSLHVLDGAQVTFNNGLSVSEAAIVLGNNSTLEMAGVGDIELLDIGPAAGVRLVGSGDDVLRTRSLVLASSGVFDIGEGSAIVDFGSSFNLRSRLVAGYNAGAWNGAGINSSYAATHPGHAVGYADASDIFSTFPATFAGQQVDDTSVLLTHTLYGDANLDRTVNLLDFQRLAANFGSYSDEWCDGNFNFDYIVNLRDFNRLASQFGQSVDPEGLELLN